MSKLILVANWKNHPGSLNEAQALLRQLSKHSRIYKKLSLSIAPPSPYFDLVNLRSKNFAHLASQNMSSMYQGAHTGETTNDILKSFGVRLAILGHSERRALGETNELVSEKVKIALRSAITPLVCVGESSRDQDGEHFEFLREQIKLSLAGLSRKIGNFNLALAYEPLWAIGKSAREAIEPADLSQSIIFIKKVLTDMFGRAAAERIPILYGGSVEPSNALALCRETGVRGFLVGHSSLNAKNFVSIAQSLISK